VLTIELSAIERYIFKYLLTVYSAIERDSYGMFQYQKLTLYYSIFLAIDRDAVLSNIKIGYILTVY